LLRNRGRVRRWKIENFMCFFDLGEDRTLIWSMIRGLRKGKYN